MEAAGEAVEIGTEALASLSAWALEVRLEGCLCGSGTASVTVLVAAAVEEPGAALHSAAVVLVESRIMVVVPCSELE